MWVVTSHCCSTGDCEKCRAAVRGDESLLPRGPEDRALVARFVSPDRESARAAARRWDGMGGEAAEIDGGTYRRLDKESARWLRQQVAKAGAH